MTKHKVEVKVNEVRREARDRALADARFANDKVVKSLRKEYKEDIEQFAPLLQAYEDAIRPAGVKLREKLDAANKVRDDAIDAARKIYDAAETASKNFQ